MILDWNYLGLCRKTIPLRATPHRNLASDKVTEGDVGAPWSAY